MSQAKVDRYKEQKKNRKKIMKHEKHMRFLGYSVATIVATCIITWAGVSIYKTYEAKKPVTATEVDLTALTDYYSSIE